MYYLIWNNHRVKLSANFSGEKYKLINYLSLDASYCKPTVHITDGHGHYIYIYMSCCCTCSCVIESEYCYYKLGVVVPKGVQARHYYYNMQAVSGHWAL